VQRESPTRFEMLEEAVDLTVGFSVALLPAFLMAIPAVILLLPLVLPAIPLAILGAILAAPIMLVRALLRPSS
jgi:hypothetical protein